MGVRLAVAFACVATTVPPADAQTVMVRDLPAGTPVDVSFAGTAIGSTVANTQGDATLVVPASASVKTEMDANFYVDTCGERRRVLVVQRGFDPTPAQPGCSRQELRGVFVVKPISTLVVNLAAAGPSILLVQGKYDASQAAKARSWALAPTGLILAAGGGLTAYRNAPAESCGSVPECSTDGSGFGYTFGAEYWFRPFLGVEATYFRPAEASARGRGENYQFFGDLDANIFTFSAKLGIPVGPARVFGKVGTNYHRATFSTTEAIDEYTYTVDGVTQTVPSGTQTLEAWTSGWRWQWGGGGEVWFSRRVAAFGEVGWLYLKGDQGNQGEVVLDDSLPYVIGGIKFSVFP